jgi:uncharacterized protein
MTVGRIFWTAATWPRRLLETGWPVAHQSFARPVSCTIFLPMSLYSKWWLGLASVLMLALTAQAEPVAKLKPTDYVNDFAHVLDQNSIAQMDDICRQIEEKAHAQIAVVTVHTLDGAEIESYAVDLFHQWGVGSKSKDSGVLIVYAIDDHRARIEVGYGLEPILTDGKVTSFQREAIPLMRSGNYGQALLLVTSRVANVIADDAHIQLTNVQPQAPVERDSQPSGHLSIGGMIAIGIVILVILFTPLRSILFWMLFSGMFGGGGGGGFSGGGGGFGGGCGFGGFGGGSSGGGGGSSSW